MPQLIPDPWFFIFISSWFILLSLAPQKILNHTSLNDPTSNPAKIYQKNWNWPWT